MSEVLSEERKGFDLCAACGEVIMDGDQKCLLETGLVICKICNRHANNYHKKYQGTNCPQCGNALVRKKNGFRKSYC